MHPSIIYSVNPYEYTCIYSYIIIKVLKDLFLPICWSFQGLSDRSSRGQSYPSDPRHRDCSQRRHFHGRHRGRENSALWHHRPGRQGRRRWRQRWRPRRPRPSSGVCIPHPRRHGRSRGHSNSSARLAQSRDCLVWRHGRRDQSIPGDDCTRG